jgi:hypothetical protein
VIGVSAAALAVALLVAPAQNDQSFNWTWSDGVTARDRTFSEAAYPDGPPQLVVRADPAEPRRNVRLEYRAQEGWRVEDADRTNGKGRARLELNPKCPSGGWCSGTYRYRLQIGGKATEFLITYRPS